MLTSLFGQGLKAVALSLAGLLKCFFVLEGFWLLQLRLLSNFGKR